MVDQHLPHLLSRHTEEMRPALNVRSPGQPVVGTVPGAPEEPQESLIYNCRRLQSMTRTFIGELPSGRFFQMVIDQTLKFARRLSVTGVGSFEKIGDTVRVYPHRFGR
jgi:hypothetical protein